MRFGYHVSPTRNRASIRAHGLDWTRIPGGERNIAGYRPGRAEEDGVFVTDPYIEDAHFFVQMGHGRRVDVWRVDLDGLRLEEGPSGWWLCRRRIEPGRLELVETWDVGAGPGSAMSPVAITDDDP